MKHLKNWTPALLMMGIIFGFSSIPSEEMPNFGGLDFSIKKFGHALGYGLLALAYLHGLGGRRYRLAWLMAVLFSATDEFHQSFVPGRSPALWDVLLFDNLGAQAGLFVFSQYSRLKQKSDAPAPPH